MMIWRRTGRSPPPRPRYRYGDGCDGGLPVDGPLNWSSGFLPAVYQGTPFRASGTPVAHLARPADLSAAGRQNQLEVLNALNAAHLARHPRHAELQARIRHFELAAQMQRDGAQARAALGQGLKEGR